MPLPVSRTLTTTLPLSSVTLSSMRPPLGVYLAALFNRLTIT